MSASLIEQMVETWTINNRINLYLLAAIAPTALDGVAAHGGRSVKAVFAHVHNVRLMWLKEAASDLRETQAAIEGKTKADKDAITHERLQVALTASGAAVAQLIERGLTTGRIRGFKPHPAAFVGYLIAHEGYHRGEIGIILAQAGTPLDDKTSYGLWEWGVR